MKQGDIANPNRQLVVRLARGACDVLAAQKLRWEVFFRERGAAVNCPTAIDADSFDSDCDHLLVEDRSGPCPRIVGTYRLLRRSVASAENGFYSASEFDLSPLAGIAGQWLELGRSCVAPEFRDARTIQLLWRGIAQYLVDHDIAMMFGCASFDGIDPDAHSAALSYLRHCHLAPSGFRVRPLESRYVEMDRLPIGGYDARSAMRGLPPLIRGYLRVGAVVGDGAVIDAEMGTIDVFIILPVSEMTARYSDRFGVTC
jgi:L-ornithine Nalpha-acyltransferase